jgi:hypothetical protein
MKEVVSGITGLTVNYYVLIDLAGFQQLIDALGGIRVTVTGRVPIGGGTSKVSGYIEPGTQRLNGYRALWLARSRHGASDYDRMGRQRCVMDAMLRQLDPGTVLERFQGIAAAGRDVVSTDVPASQLGTFLDLAMKVKSQKVRSLQFVPPEYNPAYPNFRRIRAVVADEVRISTTGQETRAAASAPAPSPAASAGGRTDVTGQRNVTSGPSGPSGRSGPSGSASSPAAGGSSPAAAGQVSGVDLQALCSPAS